ncbi:unnamed protein product [Peronospora belbahrii]|uniref:PH domain-containing protein n=1 Tax=Peronospora belbahrii TaxID=622444 RepID=A0AAU9KN92_9STRA|nr:unnamed protein product [Peronospora belbahrii]
MTAQTTKRTRSQTLPAAKHVNGDDHLSMQFRQHESLCLVNNQVQHDEQPRRKRPMVSVNLRQEASQWMRALEESMEETSFVTREAPTSAALVAPVPNLLGNRRTSNLVPVHLAVLGARRLGIPATSAPLRTSYSSADEEAIRRRRLFALQATRGGGKDDEARPATEGLVL